MNQKIILMGLLFASILSTSIYSQQDQTKTRHPLVDEITNRNELVINVAPAVSMLTGDHNIPQNFCFSIGYNRNFGRNHYLRTGIKFTTSSVPTAGTDYTTNTFYNSQVYTTNSFAQQSSFNDMAVQGSVN